MGSCDPTEDSAALSDGILTLLVLLLVHSLGSHFLRSKNCPFMTDAGLATLIGLISGAAIRMLGMTDSMVPITRLNVEFFMLFLLPPIIFESGYNLEKSHFFRQFGGILMFAFVGTLMSAFIVGGVTYALSQLSIVPDLTLTESLAFGTLISSTDPVAIMSIMKDLSLDPVLYNLVFGESIINGAVTIVMYRAITDNKKTGSTISVILESIGLFTGNFVVSFIIGSVIALLVSWILKKVNESKIQNRYNLEVSAIIFGPWVCYLVSEAVSMSGIVSALFCGIFMAQYTKPNLTDLSKSVVGRGYTVVAQTSQSLIFIFLGFGLFSFDLPFKETGAILSLCSVLLILSARVVNILANSAILNQFRTHKLNFKMQFVLWFGGLRGAIAFALAVKATHDFRDGDIILTLTLIFSLVSILGFGGLLSSVLKSLELFDLGGSIMEEGETGNWFMRIKRFVAWLDAEYLYPFFVHEEQLPQLASPKFHNESKGEVGIQLKIDEKASARELKAVNI